MVQLLLLMAEIRPEVACLWTCCCMADLLLLCLPMLLAEIFALLAEVADVAMTRFGGEGVWRTGGGHEGTGGKGRARGGERGCGCLNATRFFVAQSTPAI